MEMGTAVLKAGTPSLPRTTTGTVIAIIGSLLGRTSYRRLSCLFGTWASMDGMRPLENEILHICRCLPDDGGSRSLIVTE
jgi:hypothetical protein